jgi:hypothetical protein
MKHFFLSFVAIATLLHATAVFAESKSEEFEQYEIRSYDPQKSGLTDLTFEAHIDNLTEVLNKTQAFGKLIDVYFKIYWMAPSQYKIEVLGLPRGFQEVRDDLSTLIKGKLEFIIPERLSSKFQGYTLNKAEPVADGKLIKAIDDTYTLAIPQIDLIFDNSGRLKSVENKMSKPMKTEFFQSPKAWSNNKIVMDKIVSSSKVGNVTSTITNSIEYTSVAGIGLPSKITVKNVTEAVIPATKKDKEKKVKNETGTTIRLSKYEVNTGKAQKEIIQK